MEEMDLDEDYDPWTRSSRQKEGITIRWTPLIWLCNRTELEE